MITQILTLLSCFCCLFISVDAITFHELQLSPNRTIYSDYTERYGLTMQTFKFSSKPRNRPAAMRTRTINIKPNHGYDFHVDVDDMTEMRMDTLLSTTVRRDGRDRQFLFVPVKIFLIDFNELKQTVRENMLSAGSESDSGSISGARGQLGRSRSWSVARYINRLALGELWCRSDSHQQTSFYRPGRTVKLELCNRDRIDGFYRITNGSRSSVDFDGLSQKDLRLIAYSQTLRSVFITRWQLKAGRNLLTRKQDRWSLKFNDSPNEDDNDEDEMQNLLNDLNSLFNERVPSSGSLAHLDHSDLLEKVSMPKVQAGSETDVCGICLEEFSKDKDMARLKQCQHVYHKACISKWLNSKQPNTPSCPTCRR